MNQLEDRLPPHSIEAEQCLIGSLMICDGDAPLFAQVRSMIRRESFYQTDNAILFKVLCEMQDAGKRIDVVTVREELRQHQLLDEIGGTAYLATIVHSVPSYEHATEFARIIRDSAAWRELIRLGNEIIRAAYKPQRGECAVEVATSYASRLSQVATTHAGGAIVHIADAIESVVTRQQDGQQWFISTGLTELDRTIGGLAKGKFSIIGGRPAMGKSLFAKQIGLNVALRGTPVGIVTIEENRDKVGENVLSNLSDVANHRIAHGTIDELEWASINKARQRANDIPLWIEDSAMTMTAVEAAIAKLVHTHGCQLIIVDYLQLVDPEREETENREITLISRSLKSAFKRHNVAGLVACQLNRGGEAREVREPVLKDLRGSGSLEQDGDLIILLHRPHYYDRSQPRDYLKAIIAKNKSNCTGAVPLAWDAAHQRISDWRGSPVDYDGGGSSDPVDDIL